MARAFTLLLILLLGTMSMGAASAAATPMYAMCDHAGSCDCPQGPERCPDMMLAGACQSCCLAILPKPLNVNARDATAVAAIRAPVTDLVARALAPEPPPPRTV
jgi:hypothetical protein